MTIASEITRLQTDKEAMRQAIIDKWVDVASNISFDDYAACIAEISTWPKTWYIDLLVVGWWWAWWPMGMAWWGWWAWWFVRYSCYPISSESFNIMVWRWWARNTNISNHWENWCDSCFDNIVAYWWGWGGREGQFGSSWWSWWWNSYGRSGNNNGVTWQWNKWWNGWGYSDVWWWGWWAWWAWCDTSWGGHWWAWCPDDITWSTVYYSAGWWGWWPTSCVASWPCWWHNWWWNWAYLNMSGVSIAWTDGTTYGSGGWGGFCRNSSSRAWSGGWCQWVVILRYKTDWSSWIRNTSFGGCKYSCGDYTIHCFIDTWVCLQFIPVYK